MDDTGAFARMLASLRSTFNSRLPMGLTAGADSRLQRTLTHFIKEVVRVQGSLQEREVLRETFDSMAGWFRRKPTELLDGGDGGKPLSQQIEYAVAPDLVPGGGGLAVIGGSPFVEEDVHVALERIRAARQGISPSVAPTMSTPLELQPVETKIVTTEHVQQKDIIQRQESIVKYRDVEYNLILNSKDRDWLNSIGSQNRYQFSVIPDNNRPQGSSQQLIIMKQFRNITRLEFVKAILPVESLDIGITQPSPTPDKVFYSVLAMPFINIICNEQVGNNYGTNDSVDRSLAICQYDAAWRSDLQPGEAHLNRGYTLFFPKFMKAHRLYQPTPLSSFQKHTFEIKNPENQPRTRIPDASHVAQVLFSNAFGSLTTNSVFADTSGMYLFIRTAQWFPQWSYSKVDKVTFAGLTFTDISGADTGSGVASLTEWLQGPDGHLVLGIAHTNATTGRIEDGANSCGFANWIIIQNRMTTPYSSPSYNGACSLQPFSPSGDDTALGAALAIFPAAHQDGGVLNLSRQVQIVLRVICRELDPATNIRPDNA